MPDHRGAFLPQRGGAIAAIAAAAAVAAIAVAAIAAVAAVNAVATVLNDHVFVWRKKWLFPTAWLKTPSNNLLQRR